MSTVEERLAAIEARLAKLESPSDTQQVPPVPAPQVSQPAKPPLINKPVTHTTPLATQLLGWGGATALVLAASYIIKLALISGWLTPERQIAIAVLGGLLMIALGLKLRNHDSSYASLLPAGGITILFISVYGAHLYYGLIGSPVALASVTLICCLSLYLCHVFQSTIYALFAVVGAYSVPFLMPSLMLAISDITIYYTCWSVLFSVFSIWVGSRAVYLLALYMAMIGFDLSWHDYSAYDQWLIAVLFQTFMLVIFSFAAMFFSLRRKAAMTHEAALAHLPALLIYYFLQYNLLDKNIPDWAPWIAAASAMFIAACYGIAKGHLKQELAGGKMLLQAYLALVLFHAGYIESVSDAWAPWVAFVLLPVVGLYAASRDSISAPGFYVWLAVAIIFVLNYLRVVMGISRDTTIAPDLLSVVYAVELYAGYYLARQSNTAKNLWSLLLVAGHIAAAAAAVHLFDNRVVVSVAWGLLALGCLLLALKYKDKLLGQSSLLIFAISAGKVLIYDLSSSAPLIRIGTLLVVGCSLYAGGWLYKKIEALS